MTSGDYRVNAPKNKVASKRKFSILKLVSNQKFMSFFCTILTIQVKIRFPYQLKLDKVIIQS